MSIPHEYAPLPPQQQQPDNENHPSLQNVQTRNGLRSYICAGRDRVQSSIPCQQTQYPTKQLHTVYILLLLSQCQCLLTIRHIRVFQLDFRPPTGQDGRNKMASNMTAQVLAVKKIFPNCKIVVSNQRNADEQQEQCLEQQ